MSEPKTNAMRILDSHNVPYDTLFYECGEFTDGADVAAKIRVPPEQMFKTLVAQGKSERYCVFVIPVAEDLDMKKAARSVDEKSIELIHVKDINRITGYVRGGCSPLGIKRACRTVIHVSAEGFDRIYISGGKLGCIISVPPVKLSEVAPASFADITQGRTTG